MGFFKRKKGAKTIRKEALKRVLYGTTLASGKQYDDVLHIFRQAIEIDPDCADAHYGLGLMYAKKGMNSEAVREYDRAVEIDPRYKEVLREAGIVYESEFDIIKGLKDMEAK